MVSALFAAVVVIGIAGWCLRGYLLFRRERSEHRPDHASESGIW